MISAPTNLLLAPLCTNVGEPGVKFSYDGRDQLRSLTDLRQLVTHYTVAGFGIKQAVSSPQSGQRTKLQSDFPLSPGLFTA
ncbi:hypothetical protein [Glaciimonas immobilis]|uniref:Uncharacterized protein n=1 Tax=Glaciimonas immobilis TaxID=728004 RepID=A0A840RRM5_9BURK|nr:hypothetical protein [Glaciimonas immobilis]KAF3996833.1 hypothetical protein HAV38_16745 [Glaciimonas immobilis]MBB5199616.1 hypothetical protein [Glaciimonas immobilis]